MSELVPTFDEYFQSHSIPTFNAVFCCFSRPTRFHVTNQQTPAMPIPLGSLIADKFRVERVLGKGGMGIVVAARHVKLDEPVAIKLMLHEDLGNQASVERFLREARACAKLRNNEHIARVSDVDTLPSGLPYMVMELLDGYDLDKLLKQRGVFPIHEACSYLIQACRALADAHQKGIIHRDLKPQNLFLTKRLDGSPCIKVLDFGISKHTLADESASIDLTRPSDILGSAYYMAPEQARSSRDVVPQSDIYSLGAVLYKLLTGQPPHPKRTLLEVYEALLTEKPVRPSVFRPEIPPELDKIILRCLDKQFAHRFSTTSELSSALTPFTILKPTVKANVDSVDSDAVTTVPRLRVPKISSMHGTQPLGHYLSNAQPPQAHATQPLDAKSLHAALHGYLPPRPITRPAAPSQPQWDVAADGPTPRIPKNATTQQRRLPESNHTTPAHSKSRNIDAPKRALPATASANTSAPRPTGAGATNGTVYVASAGHLQNEPSSLVAMASKVPEMTMTPWNSFPAAPHKANRQPFLVFAIVGGLAAVVILLLFQFLS